MNTNPKEMKIVIPSCLVVGEEFSIKVKLIGELLTIPTAGNWRDKKPSLLSPFNLNDCRKIQYTDNTLPIWSGELRIMNAEELSSAGDVAELVFDGVVQGVFAEDTRPIKEFSGYSFNTHGFHFITLKDPESGLEAISNPVYVTEAEPENRIYWGDPHWQTFFSDGIRCPEELYAFARDEAFLDFGAISDHMEAVTDRQWDYFTLVTNDFNQDGRFATLVGQEWTSMKYGHRNVYIEGDSMVAIRSDDLKFDTLEKLWSYLEGSGAVLIPHHTANIKMGCDWSHGWHPELETVVEIYSGWGSSEMGADKGNSHPINHCGGELAGQHVIDALNRGYRFGFIGGGDIHDGRPGEKLKHLINPGTYKGGFTACATPSLTRKNIFNSIKERQTYATTQSRIYLDAKARLEENRVFFDIKAASEDGISQADLVVNGETARTIRPDVNCNSARILEQHIEVETQNAAYAYVRLSTNKNNFAWSSPSFAE